MQTKIKMEAFRKKRKIIALDVKGMDILRATAITVLDMSKVHASPECERNTLTLLTTIVSKLV